MVTRMREARVSRSDLARNIGATPAYVSKLLRGATNFTLDTMVKIAHAVDCEFRCHLQPSGAKSQWVDVYSSPKPLKLSFESGVPKNVIRPSQFKRVNLAMTLAASDEKRAAVS